MKAIEIVTTILAQDHPSALALSLPRHGLRPHLVVSCQTWTTMRFCVQLSSFVEA